MLFIYINYESKRLSRKARNVFATSTDFSIIRSTCDAVLSIESKGFDWKSKYNKFTHLCCLLIQMNGLFNLLRLILLIKLLTFYKSL